MSERPVLVVGGGVGGLSCAIDLAARGVKVTLIERMPQAGGKIREVQVGGASMDAGPTVFTMRWVFDELFARAGTTLNEHLKLQSVATLARHAWRAGESLDLFSDIERSADAIGALAGASEAQAYRDFCKRAQRIYNTLEGPFLRASRPTPLSLLTRSGARGLPDILQISPFATLWSGLSDHFSDPRLRQLFGRYATYCGSSPFLAPATLMLVAHVEREGVWLVRGGMHQVAVALAELASKLGVSLRYGEHVKKILVKNSRASGVELASGERIDAAAVVFNGDAAALGDGLLGNDVAAAVGIVARARRSLSAITWNLLARTEGFELTRHNVFFGADSKREFDDLFARSRVPEDPTVYVCAQDREETGSGNKRTKQRLLCLINAPATGDSAPLDPKELARCEERMFQRLKTCGVLIQESKSPPVRTTPSDFAQLFPGSGGALYGQASHGWMASFNRPGSRTRIPGLYLAGGTTHPGPGVPMAALSGGLAAASVLQDLRAVPSSTSRWQPAATPGGTSTH